LFEVNDLSKLPINEQVRLQQNKIFRDLYEVQKEFSSDAKRPEFYFSDLYKVDQAINNVSVDIGSLAFRIGGEDIFDGIRQAPEIRTCYAAFDITQGIWESELLKIAQDMTDLRNEQDGNSTNLKENSLTAFNHFSKIRFKATLSDKTYDAYIYTYRDTEAFNGIRSSDARRIEEESDFKYFQYLILKLETYNSDYTTWRGNKESCFEYVTNQEPLYETYIANIQPETSGKDIKSLNLANKRFSPFYARGYEWF